MDCTDDQYEIIFKNMIADRMILQWFFVCFIFQY